MVQPRANSLGRIGSCAVVVALLTTGCGGGSDTALTGPRADALAADTTMDTAAAPSRPAARASALPDARTGSLAPANADGTVRFIVQLESPSAARRMAADSAEQRASILSTGPGPGEGGARRTAMRDRATRYVAQVVEEQAAAVSSVQELGGRVAHRMQLVSNVLLVDAHPSAAESLRRLPGVAGVTQRRLLSHPAHGARLVGTSSSSPPCRALEPNPLYADLIAELRVQQTSVNEARAYHGFVGANARGYKGQGVVVAIVDDGVDYTHGQFVAGFDPNDVEGNRARLDRARSQQHSQDGVGLRQAGIFPKLPFVAGRDFWGRNPDRAASTVAEEDANPLPHTVLFTTYMGGTCEAMDSHGTQVASILRSMAPEVQLAAYRVCRGIGCADDAIIAAIDQATRDGADIINLSLGIPGGLVGDPMVKAVDDAALLGVIVVSAAGNDSGAFVHTVSAPAVAPRGVAVAELVGPSEKRQRRMPTDLTIMQTTSSIGPGFDGDQIKPDIGAIGNITSAAAGSLAATDFFGGTSGAAPVVSAGMAVLLSRWNGALAPHEARAILSNTATKSTVWGFHGSSTSFFGTWSEPARVDNGSTVAVTPRVAAPVVAVGGGKLRVDRAIASPVALFAADAAPDPRRPGDTAPVLPAALNFGSHVLPGTSGERLVGTRALTVRNLTASSITVPLSATVRNLDIRGVVGAVRVEVPASVNVPAWGDAQVPVKLFASPEKLRQSRYLRGPTNAEWAYGGGLGYNDPKACMVAETVCAWLDRFEGYVQVRAGGMTEVGLPWAASLYRSSNASAAVTTSTLRVANAGAYQGGKTDVFQWMGSQAYSAAKESRGEPQIVEWGAREIRYKTTQTGPIVGGISEDVEVDRRAIELAYVLRGAASNLRSLYIDPLRVAAAPYFSAIVGIDIDGDGRCGVAAFDTLVPPPGDTTALQRGLAFWNAMNDPRDMGATAPVQDAAIRFHSSRPFNDLEQWFSGSSIRKWYEGFSVTDENDEVVDVAQPLVSLFEVRSSYALGAHFIYDPARPHVIVVRVPIDENTSFNLKPPGRALGADARYFEGVRLRAGQTEVGLCPTLQSPLVPGRIALPPVRFRLGQVRHVVQGVTSTRPFVTTGVNATVTASLTRNASAPPSKGLLLVHEQGAVPVQTIAIP